MIGKAFRHSFHEYLGLEERKKRGRWVSGNICPLLAPGTGVGLSEGKAVGRSNKQLFS